MARYDKYEPIAGGTRAQLAADLAVDTQGRFGPKAVSLDANGRVVIGTAGQSKFIGVVVKNVPMTPRLGNIAGQVNIGVPIGGRAGEVVDVMKRGDIILDSDEELLPGTAYYAAANGNLTTDPTGGLPYVGHTVEGDRLVVDIHHT